ncbi:Protein sidekick-2 [Geodia barretti]|nr:Protein sidekick-2 [Geodia barretti]
MVLDCTVPTSLPPASIEWELNQAILDEPDFDSGRMGITLSGKLVISSVDLTTDNGRFYCYASNDVISDSRRYTTGHLLISGGATHPLSLPTEFVTTPTSQSVVTGDSAHFDCFTTGTPVAAISWRKDGSPLTSSDHISFSQAARNLTISSVGSEDAGSYLCVATVPSTGASIESPAASLSVIVPPTMQSSFSSLAANITEEVILSCEVVASDDGSNIQWVWRVNGSEVVTSGNVLYDRTGLISTLKILSVMEDNRGVYQCVASLVVAGGDQRQAAANGRLSVILTPPTITTEPTSDLLVFVGVAVSLPCTASGFPPPAFTWARGDGTPVELQNSRISLPAEGSGDGTLTISGAAVADSSPYQCTATNSAGFDTSSTVQLRVLVGSTVRNRPGDLAAASHDGVLTADHGARLSVPCNVTRPEDATTVVYQWYRDGTTVGTVRPDMYGAGSLVLESVDVGDRGRYTCVVEISATGVGGQPLEEEIGSVIIGVGEPPTDPFAPTALLIAMVTTNILTLSWTPPTFSGNLPLTGYLVEVMLLGNSLCPQVEPEWKVHQEVDDGEAVGVMVLGLVPFQEYMVRIRARNSANQSQPTTVPGSEWTLPDSPSAPPSNVEVTPGNQLLTVTWEHPSDCLTYGGPLTDYTVSYRISSESTFVERRVGSNKTTLTLASLRSQTTYVVLVSAHTAEGAGPTSDPAETTTYGCSTPAQPTGLTAQPVNSTAALVNWTTPTDPDDLYIVTWCHGDRETRNKVLMGRESYTYVVDLEEVGECVVTVQANNQCGTGKPANITVSPFLIGSLSPVSSQPVWETTWFIVVVAVVATLLVFGTPTVIIFIISVSLTRRRKGKTYIPSRRSASSLSGASTAFTEYHQKNGGIASGITVHSEPPPQRRCTDYADLSSYNSHMSSGPPSISSYQRQSTTETNGGPPSLHHGRETISGDRAPSPPLENFPPGVPEKKKSKRHRLRHYHQEQRVSSPDESADSWSASEYPGHVTNHMADGGSNRDWSGRPTNQLSPLHEHQVMDLSHDQRPQLEGKSRRYHGQPPHPRSSTQQSTFVEPQSLSLPSPSPHLPSTSSLPSPCSRM